MSETTEGKAIVRWSSRLAGPALALSVLLAGQPAWARGDDPPSSSMVIDANSGAVLHNKAGDAPRYPASLTKMMTLYLTFELIELGRLDYQSKVKMTEEGAAAAPSKLELEPGEEITVRDAIKALVTKSANDVAIALAQRIGGTEQNFARLMTEKARAIGMSQTVFKNASGLPDPDQVTTARDILTLALRLQDDFPEEYQLFSTRTFTYAGHIHRNHNGLLTRYRGTDGIKTGYTRASGFNLVTSVRRDGKHLVAAVFGGETAGSRNARMRSLLDAAFPKASRTVTRKPSRFLRAPTPVAARAPARATAEIASGASAAVTRPPASNTAPAPREPASPPAANPSAAQAPAYALAKVRTVPMRPEARAGEGDAEEPSPEAASQQLPHFAQAMPPSTLEAQAAALAGAPATGAVRTATAAPPAQAAAADGRFAIQIGAYSDRSEAEQHMAAARQRAGGLLDPYSAVAETARKGESQIYRARFRGFAANKAASTCLYLRRLQIDCFVVSSE